MENKVFKYNDNPITFQLGNGNTMVNATEMAKPFGKQSKDFLKTQYYKEFINALSSRRNILLNQLVIVVNGGNIKNGKGTWMHEDVAMEFARWLSPDFAIWCNDRLKELLKHGFTATDTTLEGLLANPDQAISLFTELKNERERSAERIRGEREMGNYWHGMATEMAKDVKYTSDMARFNEMLARRYFFYMDAYLKLLKENQIRIPADLKITRYNYRKDFLRLNDNDIESSMN